MRYLFLTSNEENRLERRIAEVAAAAAAGALKIPKPSIRFFRPYSQDWGFVLGDQFHSDDWINGYAREGQGIWIRSGLPEMEIAQVVVHELRHFWQFESAIWRSRTTDERENDALAYERLWPNVTHLS